MTKQARFSATKFSLLGCAIALGFGFSASLLAQTRSGDQYSYSQTAQPHRASASAYSNKPPHAKPAPTKPQASFDNPHIKFPVTLPNWILIPHNEEPVVEAGVERLDGYSPVLIAGTPIVSAPYYGVQTEFDGSNLLVNASTINKDLALLQVRQNFYNALTRRGEPLPQHPIIELSGLLQGQITYGRGFDHHTHSDINLSGAEVDIFAGLNEWISAFLQIEYDDSHDDHVRRVNNSRLTVGSAFATFGNLNANDFYFTIGQMYLPFGQYSSSLLTKSLPKVLGRTKQRAALVGYYHQQGLLTVNASGFAFHGDTDADGTVFEPHDEINGVGGNVSVHYDGPVFDIVLGASVINNLAESDGMQRVFSLQKSFEHLHRQVPAIDLRGAVTVDEHQVLAEYVAALRNFSGSRDLAHNSHGAQPQALHLEYAYHFNTFSRASTVALGYDHSWDALAIGLPESRYSAVYSIAPWRSTILSLEYRYDRDYGHRDVALVHPDQLPATIEASGNCGHSLTAQVDVYF